MSGFAVGGNIWDLFWQKKRLKIGGGGRQWCQVLEGIFDAFDVIEEIKSPCGGRGFGDKLRCAVLYSIPYYIICMVDPKNPSALVKNPQQHPPNLLPKSPQHHLPPEPLSLSQQP